MGRRRRGDDAAGRGRGARAVPEPAPPKPEETKEPPAKKTERKPLPKADAARHATHVGEFYENDENDARTRHARGYDPLDKHAQRVEAEVDGAKERRDALHARRVLVFFRLVASTAYRWDAYAGGPRSRTTSRRCGAGVWCLTSSFRNGASG